MVERLTFFQACVLTNDIVCVLTALLPMDVTMDPIENNSITDDNSGKTDI